MPFLQRMLSVLCSVVFVITSTLTHRHQTLAASDNCHQPIAKIKTNMSSKGIRDIIHKESRGYDINSPNNVPKRADYLSWDDYFLAVAYLSAQRSKDPHPSKNARDGACIVDTNKRIVGIGYDGFPRGCSDAVLPWASPGSLSDVQDTVTEEELAWLHTREPYLCHAEINAILNKCSADVEGGRMFVPNFPCK